MTKLLGLSKMKAFADNKLNTVQHRPSLFYRKENIVEKGENTGYSPFLLFTIFQTLISSVYKIVKD